MQEVLTFTGAISLVVLVFIAVVIATKLHAWALLIFPVGWAALPWAVSALLIARPPQHADPVTLVEIPLMLISFIPTIFLQPVPGHAYAPPLLHLILCSACNFAVGFGISAAIRSMLKTNDRNA